MANLSQIIVGGVTYDFEDTVARNMKPNAASVSLFAASWAGDGPYTQAVALDGVTAQSKVDMQPDAAVLAAMMDDGVSALYMANDGGALTAYAVGAAPKTDMTVQVTVTEVKV